MITEREFEKCCNKFDHLDSIASFYDLALEIVEKHPVQACVIILAVWNVGNFRFVKDREKVLLELKIALEKCKPIFNSLRDLTFCKVNFDEIQEDVKEIYNSLSKIKGIGYTGASKIMHLLNRELFVMWDSYINGNKQGVKKYYDKLGLDFKKYGTNAEGYINFLIDMQKKYCHINKGFNNRTFAKCIDESNYVTHTQSIQVLESF